MNQLLAWLSELFGSWKFWIVIPPWDVGVRVRLGRVANRMEPGLHFRLPFIDDIVLVNTRQRLTVTSPVTIGSVGIRHRSSRAQVAYRIVDPLKSMLAYEWPETSIQAEAQACLAERMTPQDVYCRMRDVFAPNGIVIESVCFNEDVEVPTFRILQGNAHLHNETYYGDPNAVKRH